MYQITIRGRVDVEDNEGNAKDVEAMLHGQTFERGSATDALLMGLPEEVAIAETVTSGGMLELELDDGYLWIVTRYEFENPLSDKSKQLLVKSTVEIWSDGIGSDFAADIEDHFGVCVDFLPLLDDYDPMSPEITEKES